jgi:hypothetical protein
MKHAGVEALKKIDALLKQIRELVSNSVIKEKKVGIFYLKSSAFLHFHEDRDDVFADIKQNSEFVRYRVTDKAGQKLLIQQLQNTLSKK